ncbi:MAG: RNA methyltransferase [Microbacteriaceae bacterium]
MSVIPVETVDDPRLADFAHRTDVALRQNGGRRGGPGIYIAESALVLQRALAAGHRCRAVLALGGTAEQAVALVGESVPVYSGPGELLAALTGYVLHRGLIASMERPVPHPPEELLAGARRVVVLEDVVDPTNVGAIFRSVAGIGADAVLVTPRCSDPLYRRAIRVSMGTVLQVPWARVGDWASTRALLAGAGFHIAALALAESAVPLRSFAAAAPERVALVLGAEGPGLTAEAIAAADSVVTIPMAHGIDSLNVAAAAAVAMYALV